MDEKQENKGAYAGKFLSKTTGNLRRSRPCIIIKSKSSLHLTKLSYLLVNKLEKIMDNIYDNNLSYLHLMDGMNLT